MAKLILSLLVHLMIRQGCAFFQSHVNSKGRIYFYSDNKKAGSSLKSTAPTSTATNTPHIDEFNTLLANTMKNSCKVEIKKSDVHRYGLFSTQNLKEGEVALQIPISLCLSAKTARTEIFKDVLDKEYDGWTGDLGLIAMTILRERARMNPNYILEKQENKERSDLWGAWVKCLPSVQEMEYHPILWSETNQEELQSSSTNKLYQVLDDIEEDATWLNENMWSKNRSIFPEKDITGQPCFTLDGFKWAMSLASSRCVFVEGSLILPPVLDFGNHVDYEGKEVEGGFMGTFGTTACVQFKTSRSCSTNEEVKLSYGPKSSCEYLLEHGFIPESSISSASAELTFQINEDELFFDDKLDILEFETGGPNPMDTTQRFDVYDSPGDDGQPDHAMVQFLRLVALTAKDAFLLESIFRNEVWGFMAEPVSENNERAMINTILDVCNTALAEMKEVESPDDVLTSTDPSISTEKRLCATVRCVERRALLKTVDYVKREAEALDLKEYYHERRLKSLGLDTPWDGDERNPDVGWGGRTPGDGNLDW